MKVTLDLDRLLADGHITPEEYARFNAFASRTAASLAFNLLVGFGVVAVSGAVLALLPSAVTAAVLGLAVCAIGVGLPRMKLDHWRVLAVICMLVGALLFAGGIISHGQGSIESFLLVAVLFAALALYARSGLLAVLATLALASCLGARSGYSHAAYYIGVQEPTLTIVLFSVFAVATYLLARRVTSAWQPVVLAACRTGVFLVNMGFWIGSLWGDRFRGGQWIVPDWVYALLWALALVAAGAWAWRQRRRWMINLVAVFAGIHFYSQWFERLDATPGTVLMAGLLALGFAFGLKFVNGRLQAAG